jgi:anti-sigma factor RsiW
MNCRKFRELIASDYMDGQLDAAATKQVRSHLDACTECAAYEQLLRRHAVAPFKAVSPMQPPDSVWERIKENIEVVPARPGQGAFAYLKDLLRPVFRMPEPVFAAGALAIFILTATLIVRWNQDQQINGYVQEQGEFLRGLDTGGGSPGSLGTTIEKLF